MISIRRSHRGWGLLVGLMALPLVLGQGCPVPGTPLTTGGIAVVVRTPSMPRTITLGDLITVTYDATGPASDPIVVSAFYDFDGLPGTGDEVVYASGLATGTGKFIQLPTVTLSPSTIYVGILAQNSGGTVVAYAPAGTTLVGRPTVTWVSPLSAASVGPGQTIPVEFRASITDFEYRVFRRQTGQAQVTLASGTMAGNDRVQAEFRTAGLQAGTYTIGVTITSPAGASVTSNAPGQITVVTGAFIQVLAPTVGVQVVPGQFVQVTVAANDPSSLGAQVRIFYDEDNTFGNGNEVTIGVFPQAAGGTNWDTTNLADGDYFIGAELLNGMTTRPVGYSLGPVLVRSTGGGTGEGLVRVTTPFTATAIVEGRTTRINWTTNLRPSEGTARVFRVLRVAGEAEPNPIFDDGCTDELAAGGGCVILVDGIDANRQFFDFDTTGLAGTFFLGVTVTPNTGEPATDYAPGTVTVIPKTFWVNDLSTKIGTDGRVIPQSGPFQGAVFRGTNFRDYLGSSMLAADDYDGDGRNEFVLAAQHGKPFLARSGGRGAGEAYFIYGSADRYSGDFDVNRVGQPSLPGSILSGIVPNPLAGDDLSDPEFARAGRSIPYTVEGVPCPPYETEGLRKVILIPDQDNDGVGELVFSFPFCNSLSLSYQVASGMHPAPLLGLGRLENNGHFLRGGVVIASSQNPLLASRTALSRHFDRVLQLHEVGQVFSQMALRAVDQLPTRIALCGEADVNATVFPCEGFVQDTRIGIDPPRLADPLPALGHMIPGNTNYPEFRYYCGEFLNLAQIDSPPPPEDALFVGGKWIVDADCEPNVNDGPPFGEWPVFGWMRVIGTGFYGPGTRCSNRELAEARPPFGARILGQTTSQCPSPPNCLSTADRFGHNVSLSGDFLMVGAPLRTATRGDVPTLPTVTRADSGTIYMYQLKRPGVPEDQFLWRLPDVPDNLNVPAPHNYIIQDAGYSRCFGAEGVVLAVGPGDVEFEMHNPIHIVGGSSGDRVGDVTGCYDLNNDGVEDFAIGAPGAFRSPVATSPRGAVYVVYRRQPEIEANYLLEDLARDPFTDPDRLSGLLIVGREGENIGSVMYGGGPLNDDYNDDGFPDLLIGAETATTAGGIRSGQVFVLFGGKQLLSPAGGTTIDALRDAGHGMLLIGANDGDLAGAAVANAGDFNGDSVPDMLIAAPNASPPFRFQAGTDGAFDPDGDAAGVDLDGNGFADDLSGNGQPDDLTGCGLVYVVFGGSHLTGTLSLSQVGTPYLPGVTFIGGAQGAALGGGVTLSGLQSQGVATAGDVDGDGRSDIMISSILASPEGKTEAGEVYLIYGFLP